MSDIRTPQQFENTVRYVLMSKENADDCRRQATKLVISMLSDLGYERGAMLAEELIRAESEE